MDAMAISTQRLAAQAANDVVGNTVGSEKDFAGTSQESFLGVLNQTMSRNGVGKNALKLNTGFMQLQDEQEAQEITAEMIAQNPFLMMLLMQNGIDTNSAAQIIKQASNGEGLEAISQSVQGNPQSAKQMLLQLTQQLQGDEAPLLAAQQQAPEQNNAFKALNEQVSIAAQTNNVAQAQQGAQQQQAAQAPVSTPQAIAPIIAEALKPQVQNEQQTQPAQLFEQTNAQAMVQRVRISNVQHSEQASSDSTKGDNSEHAQELKAQVTKPKQEEALPSGVNTAQQGFEKQLQDVRQAASQPQTAKPEGTQEVIRQTAEGIKQNLVKGKQEFTMSLKPEGLGEISVKFESLNGKITLQLTAQNQSVQKMLEGELEALRQAVKPYNVEVREIGGGNNASLDMSFSSQSNQHEQQAFAHMNGRFAFNEGNSKQQSPYEAFLNGESSNDTDTQVPEHTTLNSAALDTYI